MPLSKEKECSKEKTNVLGCDKYTPDITCLATHAIKFWSKGSNQVEIYRYFIILWVRRCYACDFADISFILFYFIASLFFFFFCNNY